MKDLKNKILLMGAEHHLAESVISQLSELNKEVVIVIQPEPERGITINGKTYIEKEPTKKSHAIGALAMAVAMYMPTTFARYGSKMSNLKVDIVHEFSLIQEKKSNLSKSQRDWVVNQFNRKFKVKE